MVPRRGRRKGPIVSQRILSHLNLFHERLGSWEVELAVQTVAVRLGVDHEALKALIFRAHQHLFLLRDLAGEKQPFLTVLVVQ